MPAVDRTRYHVYYPHTRVPERSRTILGRIKCRICGGYEHERQHVIWVTPAMSVTEKGSIGGGNPARIVVVQVARRDQSQRTT